MTRKPKMLLASPYFAPKVGGLENYAYRISQELIARGWDVIAVAANHEAKEFRVDNVDGVKVYRLPASFTFSNTSFGFDWARRIRKIIKEEKPDVINGYTPVPGMADAAARAAGKTPFCITYHAATLYKQDNLLFNAVIFGYRFLEKFLFNKARMIITVTPYHKDKVSKKTGAKFRLVENAIPDNELLDKMPSKKPHKLLFINNLHKAHAWKGLDDILEAVAIYKQSGKPVHLDVVGDGDCRQHYEQHAADLGITKEVTFHGQQTAKAKYDLLKEAAVYVAYPTAANDAFPTVILEAWSHFAAVIAADIGALPYVVNDGQDGVLAAPRNPQALAAAIDKVFGDPALRKQLALAGRKRAEALTWSRQGAKTEKLLKELMS